MRRTLLTAASSAGTAALLLFAVSACGGGSSPSTASPTSGATSGTQQNQSARPGFGQGLPGASGKVAAISGTTLQVQSVQTGQVAVTYTATTRFTEQVKAAASAVKVGTCVSVRGSGGQAAASATSGPVTAVSVTLTEPVNGECGRAGFGGGGTGGGGFGGARPSGAPTGAPGGGATTGRQRGGAGGFAGARPVSGKVTAVNGSTITVAAVTFGGRGTGAGGGTASPAATPSTSPVEVLATAATTYTKTVSATAKDLAVGECVTAVGPANDTGAVTATLIASQPAVNGQCTTGFGGFGGGAGRPTSGSS